MLTNIKIMSEINLNHFKKLATKAQLLEFLALKIVKETVEAVKESWNRNQKNYPLENEIVKRISKHVKQISLT